MMWISDVTRAPFRLLTLLLGFVLLPAAAAGPADETPSGTTPVRPAAVALERVLATVGADRWHAAGQRGRGMTVAVLDSGFRGWRDHLGEALPDASHVRVRSFRDDGNFEARNSQHGILCGEVIHALAPEADLLLANWEPEKPESFLAAVRWAKGQGAKVITCSVVMPSWSDCEGGGRTHRELTRLLGDGRGPNGVLLFASAGNTAQRHWCGDYRPGVGGWHVWDNGSTSNVLTPWGTEEQVSVELCCPTGCGYEVVVEDDADGKVIARDAVLNHHDTVAACAAARFFAKAGHSYRVKVRHTGGPREPFHIVALGAYLACIRSSGSIPFPGDGPEVIAVAAVDEDGRRAAYSSCGPNSRLPKPDLAAVVPFPSRWRAKSFSGTSAAAPQAAAVAALCWAGHPDWTAAAVRRTLERSAHDLGPAGHDCETGFGQVALPRPPEAAQR